MIPTTRWRRRLPRLKPPPWFPSCRKGSGFHRQALVWVTSPSGCRIGCCCAPAQELLAAGNFPPMGIVTASTLDGARALWERRKQAGVGPMFTVSSKYPTASVFEGRILAMDQDPPAAQPLSLASLQQALSKAGYLTYFGHGGGRTWSIDESAYLTAADVPDSAWVTDQLGIVRDVPALGRRTRSCWVSPTRAWRPTPASRSRRVR